jgi:hypothetical protein
LRGREDHPKTIATADFDDSADKCPSASAYPEVNPILKKIKPLIPLITLMIEEACIHPRHLRSNALSQKPNH